MAIKRDRLARMGSIFDPDWQLTHHASTPVLILLFEQLDKTRELGTERVLGAERVRAKLATAAKRVRSSSGKYCVL